MVNIEKKTADEIIDQFDCVLHGNYDIRIRKRAPADVCVAIMARRQDVWIALILRWLDARAKAAKAAKQQ